MTEEGINRPVSDVPMDENGEGIVCIQPTSSSSSLPNESQLHSCSLRSDESYESTGGGQESSGQSLSTNMDPLSQSTFKKIPELSKYYVRKRSEQGKISIYCQACSKEMHTREYARLRDHVAKCTLVPPEDKIFLSQKMSDKLSINGKDIHSKKITLLWARVMVENKISPDIVNSASFRAFAKAVIPSWKLPTKQSLTSILKNHIYLDNLETLR